MQTLKISGFILLFFALCAGVLLVALFVLQMAVADPQENAKAMLIMIFSALLLIGITFVPYLNFAMRRSYVFRPEAAVQPIPQAQLRDELLSINSYAVPVTVTENRGKLIVQWRYVDGEVWGLLAKSRLRKTYELHVKFDDARKEAILTDVKKSARWGAGPDAVRFGFGFTRGYLVGVEIGQAWGITRNFMVGKAYKFRFSPAEIKGPVLNTIFRSGWTVRFGMW